MIERSCLMKLAGLTLGVCAISSELVARQQKMTVVLLGSKMIDKTIHELMADDDATMLERERGSDLFWGMSHRKAIAHDVKQVRLARELEEAILQRQALSE